MATGNERAELHKTIWKIANDLQPLRFLVCGTGGHTRSHQYQ